MVSFAESDVGLLILIVGRIQRLSDLPSVVVCASTRTRCGYCGHTERVHDDGSPDGYLRLRYQPASSGGEAGPRYLRVRQLLGRRKLDCSIEDVCVPAVDKWFFEIQ
jgi:hypothetical protein